MRNRSVIEIMVLVLTGVVAVAIVCTGALIGFLEIRDASTDTTEMTKGLLALIATILGALLGLLAGKAESVRQLERSPELPPPEPPPPEDEV